MSYKDFSGCQGALATRVPPIPAQEPGSPISAQPGASVHAWAGCQRASPQLRFLQISGKNSWVRLISMKDLPSKGLIFYSLFFSTKTKAVVQASTNQTFVVGSFLARVCTNTMNGSETLCTALIICVCRGKNPTQCASGWEQVNIYELFFDASFQSHCSDLGGFSTIFIGFGDNPASV